MYCNRTGGLFMTLLMLSLLACAGGMSDQVRSTVTYWGPFSQVQASPKRYIGETVMWGGKILEIKPLEGATEVTVLQLDLGDRDKPRDNDQSQGRYVARSTEFLDPAVFSKGTLITTVGPIVAFDPRPIGQMTYTYPVIDIDEIKKWPASGRQRTQFHFGIGVGTHF
jgi:outer membrane lipoprotein